MFNLADNQIMEGTQACQIWGKARNYISQTLKKYPNRFPEGSIRKVGNCWIVTRFGMSKLTGDNQDAFFNHEPIREIDLNEPTLLSGKDAMAMIDRVPSAFYKFYKDHPSFFTEQEMRKFGRNFILMPSALEKYVGKTYEEILEDKQKEQ